MKIASKAIFKPVSAFPSLVSAYKGTTFLAYLKGFKQF